jgi:hypothetical protein
MKKLTLFIALNLLLLLAANAQAQDGNENRPTKVELNFQLAGDAKTAEAKFNDPKSKWKLQYELFLTDFSTLENSGRCKRNEETGRFVCMFLPNKKIEKQINKKIKKASRRVAKGKLTNKNSVLDSSRQITIFVALSPTFKEIFDEAIGSKEKNPTFVLFIKTTSSNKDDSGKKIGNAFSTSSFHTLKNYAVNPPTFWSGRTTNGVFTITVAFDILK